LPDAAAPGGLTVNRDELQRRAIEAMRDERYLEQRDDTRAPIVRRALLLTPPAIGLTALLVYAAMNLPQSILMVIIVGIAAIAIDIEAIAAL
jgi:hypothetical protein